MAAQLKQHQYCNILSWSLGLQYHLHAYFTSFSLPLSLSFFPHVHRAWSIVMLCKESCQAWGPVDEPWWSGFPPPFWKLKHRTFRPPESSAKGQSYCVWRSFIVDLWSYITCYFVPLVHAESKHYVLMWIMHSSNKRRGQNSCWSLEDLLVAKRINLSFK